MSHKVLLSAALGVVSMCIQMVATEASSMEFHVSAKQHAKSKLLIAVVGDITSEIKEIFATLKKDLEFSGQFEVSFRSFDKLAAKHDITQLCVEGFTLAFFVNESHHGKTIEWRLYDTALAEMLKGQKYHKRGAVVRGWAHHLADAFWPELTGQEGFFSSKIAYCKEVPGPKKRKLKHIYLADFDGSHEEELVSTPLNVAPRFNKDLNNPLVFYSENTNENIRLMLVNMNRRRKVASNFDGITMVPTFSADGSKVVYCASQGHGNCQLHYFEKGIFKQLTSNGGNNVSPSMSDDATRLYYCSDFDTGVPQIYCYNLITGAHTPITNGAEACFCPSYCTKKRMLAYAKMMHGIMQIFVYDEVAGEHTQLTFDKENKDECCWSPCGNYLMFCSEKGNSGRIALLNLMTNERKYITPATAVCCYPTWSPIYNEFPVIKA